MKYRNIAGHELSILGFGAMRFPMIGNKIDEKETVAMLRAAIDNGLNYVDTAYYYHEGQSEPLVGKALSDGYREKTYLATKLPIWDVNAPSDFERILDDQLKRLQTEHIDFYLMHALNKGSWEKTRKLELMSQAEKAKQKGKIRHIGFSFHDSYPILESIIDGYNKWEFCQLQVNYIDTDGQAGLRGLHYAAERGLPVIIMEPLWGGKLANPPKAVRKVFEDAAPGKTPVEWALDWLWAKPAPRDLIVLSGMSTMQQVTDNIEYAGRAPEEIDQSAIEKAREVFKTLKLIPCTGCSYCGCPHGVAIPNNFDCYNEAHIDGRGDSARDNYTNMVKWAGAKAQAKNCIACGSCEELCPQHIRISEEMPKVAAHFS